MPNLKKWREWAVPLAILAGIFVILTPLPTGVIDLLIGGNMILAIIILTSALLAKSSSELSVFPAILLVSTLGRLVLNISTTRLILSNATATQDLAAGGIIKNFGDYVIGDDVFVGLVIFAIIFIVQFVVVTKGSSRISEVAARFALDGMPGKQMAIDADLKAKLISPEEARHQREKVQEKADFLGAMDGAGRFVRGDAIAGLIITLVNIVGGLAIGLLAGMELKSAVSVFTLLTIGDGLASQLPAFLVAIAAGILMAKGNREASVSEEMVEQLGADPRVMFVAAGGTMAMVLAGLPALPLLTIGGICLAIGLQNQNQAQRALQQEQAAQAELERKRLESQRQEQGFESLLKIDPIEIRLGVNAVRFADPKQGGTLFQNVSQLREVLLKTFGFVLPKVRIADDFKLKENRFQIYIHGDLVCESDLNPNRLLALDRGNTKAPIQGEEYATEIGKGVWIEPELEHRAEFFRYLVLQPTQLIVEFLRRRAVQFAPDLFTRDSASQLIDEARKNAPMVVQELIPAKMSLSEVQQVLKNLLAERVSIRQLALILETLGDYSPQTNQVDELVGLVRQKLSRGICSRLAVQQCLHFVEFEKSIESRMADQFRAAGQFKVELEMGENEFKWFASQIEEYRQPGRELVLIVDQRLRLWVKDRLLNWLPELNIIGRDEICSDLDLQKQGEVSLQPVIREEAA